MNSLIADRGYARYGASEVKQLTSLLEKVSMTHGDKCACCNRRVCWHYISALEEARQFALHHVPHKDENSNVIIAWAKLVALVTRSNLSAEY